LTSKKLKILFVSRLYHDVSGGVERMSLALMNELCSRGHNIELLSWDSAEARTFYDLDSRVCWHKLSMGDARFKAGWMLRLSRIIAIRKVVSKINPDLIIAFQHGPFLSIAIAILGLNIRIIAAERNAPDRFFHLKSGKFKDIIFQTFRLADCVTIQFDEYKKKYPDYLQDRIVAIPNPVFPVENFTFNKKHNNKKFLLCVGRLSYQKNQSVLIKAFAKIAHLFPEWNLLLVGSGEDEKKLSKMVLEYTLDDRILFFSATLNIEHFYKISDLFCLPSRWEGFPNALAEAMAFGLPCVGYRDCSGVNQLIEDGLTGLLAGGMNNADSLAEILITLMRDENRRLEIGKSASEKIKKYSPEVVFNQWDDLIKKINNIS
jgi:glycosyltransferase involved in cell wall biosynthesis